MAGKLAVTDHSVIELLVVTDHSVTELTRYDILHINILTYMPLRGCSKLTGETFFFVTTTVVSFLDVFSNHKCCEALITNIKFYQTRFEFEILGYVIMPSHFHWIVEVKPELGTISDIMRDIKKYSAWDIMEILSAIRQLTDRWLARTKMIY